MQDIVTFLQTHWALSLGLLIVFGLLVLLELLKQKQSLGVTTSQATQLINRENAVIIDLRSADGYASGHILNAVSIPFAEFSEKLKKIEKYKTQPIILVCMTGADSVRALQTLQKQGYRAYTLSGGLRAWREAELPLVKGA